MSQLSNIHQFDQPTAFHHTVLKENTGLKEHLTGKLYHSREGYIYNDQPTSVLWIKFLGLGLSVPLRIVIAKVVNVFKRVFNIAIPIKGAHHTKHMLRLTGIAWKGVFGWKKTLQERAAEYSIAELKYNSSDIAGKLDRPRSRRIKTGYYTALCMHPLFHKSQIREGLIGEIMKAEKDLRLHQLFLPRKQAKERGVFSYFKASIKDAFFGIHPNTFNAINHLTAEEIEASIQKFREFLNSEEVSKTRRLLRYADITVINKHTLPIPREKVLDKIYQETTIAPEEKEWFKHQRCCGSIHRIECCDSITCWAIECMCCVICCIPNECEYVMIA